MPTAPLRNTINSIHLSSGLGKVKPEKFNGWFKVTKLLSILSQNSGSCHRKFILSAGEKYWRTISVLQLISCYVRVCRDASKVCKVAHKRIMKTSWKTPLEVFITLVLTEGFSSILLDSNSNRSILAHSQPQGQWPQSLSVSSCISVSGPSQFYCYLELEWHLFPHFQESRSLGMFFH